MTTTVEKVVSTYNRYIKTRKENFGKNFNSMWEYLKKVEDEIPEELYNEIQHNIVQYAVGILSRHQEIKLIEEFEDWKSNEYRTIKKHIFTIRDSIELGVSQKSLQEELEWVCNAIWNCTSNGARLALFNLYFKYLTPGVDKVKEIVLEYEETSN